MAHFAEIDENNIVIRVLVVEQEFINTGALGNPEKWIQTSYNTHGGIHYDPNTNEPDDGTPLRKNYAGKGYTYDSVKDAFIPPKPYNSWKLNEDSCLWESPVPYPQDNKMYYWNEEEENWFEIEIVHYF